MPTPIGDTDPYATPQDVIAQCDVRTLGDFLSDTGDRLTPDEVADSDLLWSLLAQASGEVESALMVGGKYTLADLQALTGNSRQLLVNIVVGLALENVFDRRPDRQQPQVHGRKVERARERLQQLRQGERIFALQEQADAGRPDHEVETPAVVEARNLNTFIGRRFFGRRSNRIDRSLARNDEFPWTW